MELQVTHELATLSNGLRVVVHETHAVPIVAVSIWYHVGSRDERPGRTGLAHLFEHLMFAGSTNVPEGEFDRLLAAVGATSNGSTANDRTNFWQTLPAHALPLAFFLEADRMAGLLPALTAAALETQRAVVMNERRETHDNRPYGHAGETLCAALYPAAHPYRWPVIGHMADLRAITRADVHAFGRTFYTPGNATLAVAGAVRAADVFRLADAEFGTIPATPRPARPAPVPGALAEERRPVLEDRVRLPRLYLSWHSPSLFAAGDAELDILAAVLADGHSARLYRLLIHELEVAQQVTAYQSSAQLGSSFNIIVTARPDMSLSRLEHEVRAVLRSVLEEGITERELERSRNALETSYIDALQSVGDFDGVADRLNLYLLHTGDPAYFAADLRRYQQATTAGVQEAARAWLTRPAVALSVVPYGRTELAAV